MNIDGPKLWGIVDPAYVVAPGKESCPFRRCTLYSDHEGPHLDAHHSSGRIFGLWPNNEEAILPSEVSDEAVRVVRKLNRLRDEAIEATEAVMAYRHEVAHEYQDTTDEHMRTLLKTSIFPTSEHEIPYSGTEMSEEANIREELLDILGLNGEEDS